MNRIEKLISELCPDGVEYEKLREVLEHEQIKRVPHSEAEFEDRKN